MAVPGEGMTDAGGYADVNLPVLLADSLPPQWKEACSEITALQESLIVWRKKKSYLEAVASAAGIALP